MPRLIQQLYRKRVTGRLCITDDAGDQSTVFLREGSAVHIERPNDVDRLDRVLSEMGLVSQRVLTRAEQVAEQQGKRLGQVLVELGALSPDVLSDAIRAQLRRKLFRLFFIRQGRYEVFLQEHAFGADDELARIRLDPRSLIYPGIRTAYDDVRLMEELRPLSGFAFRLVQLPTGFVEAMGIPAQEAILKTLQERLVRLEELGRLGQKAPETRALLLALLYSDLLQTERLPEVAPAATPAVGQGASPLPLGPAPSKSAQTLASVSGPDAASPQPPPPRIAVGSGDAIPRPVPPGSTGPVITGAELRKRIALHSAKLDEMTLFQVLGLGESATLEQVSAAYMQGVRQFHPDRLVGLGLADLVKDAERIMAKYGEASSVLSDSKRRSEYVRKLRGQPTEADSARNILEAEQAFRQGEAALKRGDFPKALERFNEAVRRNPAEAEYRAYFAWARYSEPNARRSVLASDTLRMIREALSQRPHFARGLYWIGEMMKHQGDGEAAEKAFRDCLEVDKDFLEAERELRLIEMRRSKGKTKEVPTPEASSGGKSVGALLNRLLKR